MSNLVVDNQDLSIWEGWIGDIHSIAATWHRAGDRALLGYQLYAGSDGCISLILLDNGIWHTKVRNVVGHQAIRREMLRYITKNIARCNQQGALTETLEESFIQAQKQLNQWLIEQSQVIRVLEI